MKLRPSRHLKRSCTGTYGIEFLKLAPVYGGSLIERTPFALLPGLWGGGSLAVYRAVAAPCLLATAFLGVWLVARMRATGAPRLLARAVALGVCVANPIALRALELGHPEELLGCLPVRARRAARRGSSSGGRPRPLLAGVVLGLAIANKEWALLAVGPVVLAVPPRAAMALPRRRDGDRRRDPRPAAAHLRRRLHLEHARDRLRRSEKSSSRGSCGGSSGTTAPLVHGTVRRPQSPAIAPAPRGRATISHPLILVAGAVLTVAAVAAPLERRALSEQDGAAGARAPAPAPLPARHLGRRLLPAALRARAARLGGRALRARAPALALSVTALVWVSFQWLARTLQRRRAVRRSFSPGRCRSRYGSA